MRISEHAMKFCHPFTTGSVDIKDQVQTKLAVLIMVSLKLGIQQRILETLSKESG